MTSLSARVSLSAALVLGAFVAITALALEHAFEDSARSAMRERLFAQLYLVMAATEVDRDGIPKLPERLGEPRLNLPGSGLYARIGTAEGRLLWQSPSAVGLKLPVPPPSKLGEDVFTRQNLQDERYFLAVMGIEWETDGARVPLVFSVSESPAPFQEQMQRYRNSLWGWLGAMALLLLAALAASLAWGLRPLRIAAAEVRAIEAGKQDSVKRSYPKELRRLTDNINTLLHHERAQQVRYKNALADLAHSLKTPLAVLRGLGEAGADKPMTTLEEQVARMDDIVQYQLQRAATAGRSALATPIPVAATAHRLLATLAKVYRDKGVSVQPALDERARFHGDEGDLMELLGNLLDNAYKWCGNKVWITARCEDSALFLSIDDDGPGIEPARAEQVLQRGVRLDEATPGHGIGLPMVRDIVEAYEGKLGIRRSEYGGASIQIRLPGC